MPVLHYRVCHSETKVGRPRSTDLPFMYLDVITYNRVSHNVYLPIVVCLNSCVTCCIDFVLNSHLSNGFIWHSMSCISVQVVKMTISNLPGTWIGMYELYRTSMVVKIVLLYFRDTQTRQHDLYRTFTFWLLIDLTTCRVYWDLTVLIYTIRHHNKPWTSMIHHKTMK